MASEYVGLSFWQILKRLASQSLTYILGSIGLRFGSFLLLPILTRYLQPSDYGIISLVTVTILIIGSILAVGIPEAVLRMYFDYKGEDTRKYLGSAWIFSILYASAITCLLYFFSEPLFKILLTKIEFDPYIKLAILSAFFTNFTYIPMILMRAREQSVSYITINIITFLLDIGLRLYFVIVLKQEAIGFIKGSMYAHLIMSILLLVYMHRQISYTVNRKHIKETLKFCLPLFPSVLMTNVSGIFDRFVMDRYVQLDSLGIYNIGFMIGQILRVFTSAVKTAWVTFYMQIGVSRKDAGSILSKIATYYYTFIVLIGLGLSVFAKEILIIMTTEPFYSAYQLVPWFVIAELFMGFRFIVASGIMLKKKTEYAPVITVIALALSIASSLLLIPRIGIYGAAYTLIITNASFAIASLIFSQRFFHINYEWKNILVLTISALLLGYVASIINIDSLIINFLFHILLVVVWILTNVLICFRSEFTTAYSMLRKRFAK